MANESLDVIVLTPQNDRRVRFALANQNYSPINIIEGNADLGLLGGRYAALLGPNCIIFPDAYELMISELRRSETAIVFGSIAFKEVEVFEDAILAERKRERFRLGSMLDLFAASNCPMHCFVIDRQKIAAKDLYLDMAEEPLTPFDLALRLTAAYESSFRLGSKVVGELYMSGNEVALADRLNRKKYVLSPAVQRILGTVTPIEQETIDSLMARVR